MRVVSPTMRSRSASFFELVSSSFVMATVALLSFGRCQCDRVNVVRDRWCSWYPIGSEGWTEAGLLPLVAPFYVQSAELRVVGGLTMVKMAESPYMGRVLLLLASFRALLRGPWPEVEELGRARRTL